MGHAYARSFRKYGLLGADGRMKGEGMNPGVFTFRVVIDFADGHSEVRYGDITLVR